MTTQTPLQRAIEVAGSMRTLGEKIGVTKGAVHQWTLPGRAVPPERCVSIETATGVSRYDLRPDIFGEAPDKAA